MTNSRAQQVLNHSLAAFAFCLPLSIAMVQPAAYLSALLAAYIFFKNRKTCSGSYPFKWPVAAFMAVVLLTALTGSRPGHSFEKMNRFVLFFLAWAIPFSLCASGNRTAFLTRMLTAFVLGAVLKATYDFIRVPASTQMGIPLFETGNMRDPQMYYTAICLTAGMFMSGAWTLRYPPSAVGFLVLCGGLVIHFKRGAWVSCLCALAVMAFLSRKWRYLGVVGLIAVLLFSLPQTRERIGQLQNELDTAAGGRLTLWTQVAPELLAAHPLGMGWKGTRHEDFIAVNADVEPGLNHLHNNFLQVTLELSVLGLAAWIFLMASMFMLLIKLHRKTRERSRSELSGTCLGALGALTALVLNGMVEYNFGDSEIFMVLLLLMGLAAGAAAAERGQIAAPPAGQRRDY